MQKKGALELSLQSIIVFILAIIVLAALVVAIRGIIGKIQPPPTGPDVNNLGRTPASANTPLTIGPQGDSIDVSSYKKSQSFAFEFFNTGSTVTDKMNLKFDKCYGSRGQVNSLESVMKVSSIVLLTSPLNRGDLLSDQNFRIDTNGIEKGSYDCIIGIYNNGNELAKQTVSVNVQ